MIDQFHQNNATNYWALIQSLTIMCGILFFHHSMCCLMYQAAITKGSVGHIMKDTNQVYLYVSYIYCLSSEAETKFSSLKNVDLRLLLVEIIKVLCHALWRKWNGLPPQGRQMYYIYMLYTICTLIKVSERIKFWHLFLFHLLLLKQFFNPSNTTSCDLTLPQVMTVNYTCCGHRHILLYSSRIYRPFLSYAQSLVEVHPNIITHTHTQSTANCALIFK